MNKSNVIENTLRMLQIINLLMGILGTMTFDNKWIIIFTVLFIFIIISLITELYLKERYIRFVEFLFENTKHNFILLPKMRMYLRKEKMRNKLKICSMEVKYNVKHKESTESSLLGDAEIIYNLKVYNKSIPKSYKLIIGNDYSDKMPQFYYKYGDIEDYLKGSPEEKNCAPYYKNVVRELGFTLEKNHITQSEWLEISFKLFYENSFEFEHNYFDTIICLPKIYGDSIEYMKYDINLDGFPNDIDFYFFTYSIFADKLNFVINDIPNKCVEKNKSFSVEFNPNSTKDEKAYYFRLGTLDTDKENRF